MTDRPTTNHGSTDDTITDDGTDTRPASGTSRRNATTDREGSAAGLGRRGFLKKAAAAAVAGVTGIAAADEAGASAPSHSINVWGYGSQASNYEIHMGGPYDKIYYGDKAELHNDTINYDHDEVDGLVGWWNQDSYDHDGNVHYIEGHGDLGFYFSPGWEPAYHNEILVRGRGSGHHEYYIEVDGDIELGDEANPAHDDDRGSYVFGHVWERNEDRYTHTGPVTQLEIEGDVQVLLL